jgi:hypothetical protein
MRRLIALLPLTSLAACGGGGGGGGNLQTLSTTAITPPSGTAGTSSSSTTGAAGSFVSPTAAKTYAGVGATQSLDYKTDSRVTAGQQALVYAGNATTVRNSPISVTYDPRDAIFTLAITDANSGATTSTRFQDAANRTNFGGATEPQWGVLNLNNASIRYLQAGTGNPTSPYGASGNGYVDPGTNSTPPTGESGASIDATSFFYEVPGSTTKYVTYAGYIRNKASFSQATVNGATVSVDSYHIERGAFAYGELTPISSVPTTGTASYTGAMLATMIDNPLLDRNSTSPNYFQWISGTSKLDVNFGSGTVGLSLNGRVSAPQIDQYTAPTTTVVPAGATFTATGSGNINLTGTGGFTGSMTSASISGVTSGAGVTGVSGGVQTLNVAGSSINGAFYGPAAEEVGGGFRVVGGTPDQRIDIMGTFTGAK